MSHRSKLGAVALCAVLLIAGYGQAAGWHERVADGYRRAQADDGPDAVLAAPPERPRGSVRRSGEPTVDTDRIAPTRGTGTAAEDAEEPPEDDASADAEPDGAPDDAPAEDGPDEAASSADQPEATPDESSEPDAPATPEPEAAEPDGGASEPEASPADEPDGESSEPEQPADAERDEPEPGPSSTASEPSADPAGRMAELVADFRRQEGLAPLRRSAGLDEIARSWAQVMADEGGLRHNPDVEQQVRDEHGCCRVAENVVHNEPADVDRAHRSLLESSSHRRHLAGDYQRIGIGIVIDDQNRLWGVQVFHGD